MELVPEHRVLFGIDVIGSARYPGHQRASLTSALNELMYRALWESEIGQPEILDREHTGDGAVLTLTSHQLGKVLDLTRRLDTVTADHNRHREPSVRLRAAVVLGPVGDEPGFYGARITHSRLLNAAVFKRVLDKCLTERPDGSVSTGAIVSEHAFEAAFAGDHTRLVRAGDFAQVDVREKEYTGKAWICVPGFDARTIGEYATKSEPETERAPEHPASSVNNSVGGDADHFIQAGHNYGSITLDGGR